MSTPDNWAYAYQELDEATIDRLSAQLGYSENAPQMGREITRFYISLMQPSLISTMLKVVQQPTGTEQKAEDLAKKQEPGEAAGSVDFKIDMAGENFPLPMYLYHQVDEHFNRAIHLRKQGATGVDGVPNNYKIMMPEWYFAKLEELKNVEQVNAYIIFVMTNYETLVNGNPTARQMWDEKFPWIVEERKKHYYAQRKISDRLFRIQNEGYRSQGDMLFVFILQSLAAGNDALASTLPMSIGDLSKLGSNKLAFSVNDRRVFAPPGFLTKGMYERYPLKFGGTAAEQPHSAQTDYTVFNWVTSLWTGMAAAMKAPAPNPPG